MKRSAVRAVAAAVAHQLPFLAAVAAKHPRVAAHPPRGATFPRPAPRASWCRHVWALPFWALGPPVGPRRAFPVALSLLPMKKLHARFDRRGATFFACSATFPRPAPRSSGCARAGDVPFGAQEPPAVRTGVAAGPSTTRSLPCCVSDVPRGRPFSALRHHFCPTRPTLPRVRPGLGDALTGFETVCLACGLCCYGSLVALPRGGRKTSAGAPLFLLAAPLLPDSPHPLTGTPGPGGHLSGL